MMDNDELIDRFEKIKESTKSKIDSFNEYDKVLFKNTTIALLYIEKEHDSLKEYVKHKTYNKNDAIMYHLRDSIGKFNEKVVEKAIFMKFGYASDRQIANVFFIVAILSLIVFCGLHLAEKI